MKPKLTKGISLKEFTDHYWLKEELIQFCRSAGINSSGGKIEIAKRITKYLSSGKIIKTASKKNNTTSNFNWKTEKLDSSTIITDNYKNSENVRSYFQSVLGAGFKFNVEFMNWMKKNLGKTLKDAAEAWTEINEKKKDKNIKTDIAPQFEYNTYIRDFLQDNSRLKTKDAIKCWKIKRDLSGPKKYNRKDLEFLK